MLDKIMRDKKITSKSLSEKTGIPKRTIDDYRGSRKKEPSLSRGIKIADALGVDPRELIKKDAD